MDNQQTFLTREGYQKLEQELHFLRTVRRQQVARRLHQALSEGELLDNAELEDARNEQSFVEGRILTLEGLLRNAVIIEEIKGQGPREAVGLGSRVTVVEGDGPPETYHIVGSAEADPGKGLISNESPLGRALMGRKVGEEAVVNAPAGLLVFEIVAIQ
jgi:transcription elongation factor GreA